MHHDYNECYALQTTEKKKNKMKQSKNKNKNKEEGKDGKLIKISQKNQLCNEI